jgi:prephenate dehydratase
MKQRVAFQGERGAYSEIVTIKYFPDEEIIPMRSFQDIFRNLDSGGVDFAIIPVENSIEGSVNEVYDLLLRSNATVCRETHQRISHCLIVNKNFDSAIKSVYSHPQALAQCRKYIQERKLESIPTYDTAGAVRLIKDNRIMNAAAIASERAARLYDMQIADHGIEDEESNYTRFFVLSKKEIKTQPSGHDATSIIFSINHLPGSLFNILGEFAKRDINLTRIESRPTKEMPWEYNFYVDIDGHSSDTFISEALELIEKKSNFFKILGSYTIESC